MTHPDSGCWHIWVEWPDGLLVRQPWCYTSRMTAHRHMVKTRLATPGCVGARVMQHRPTPEEECHE